LSTDNDWDKWGEIDPYFGVLSSDEYHADNLNEESRANFFHSGDKHIGRILANVRRHLDANYQPARSLDFGCGVGRLVIPLAALSETVVGVDVSDHMIAEAASNCQKRQIENVSFVKSDDGLTQLNGSFDLIHSCLVLQHIPTKRGLRFISALLDHLEPGGVVVIQFYYACEAPKLIRALVNLRYRLPIANAARNLMRGRPLREPAMQLHTYDFGTIIGMFKAVGISSFYFQPGNHGEFQSVTLYAQKSKTIDANID
jgi:SAM-dependent methyltransferase